MDIEFKLNPEKDEIDKVVANLSAHIQQVRGESGYQAIGFLLRDADGAVVGGLTGFAIFDWLFVQFLSVPEDLRHQGWGTKLLDQAEAWARERGLVGVWLDTFAFQAPGFYEKLGFTRFGTIEDHPRNSRRIFFQKRFEASARQAAAPK